MIHISTSINTNKYRWLKWLFIVYRPNRIGDHQSLQKRNKRQKKIVNPNLTSNDIATNRIHGIGIFTYTNTIKSTNHVGKKKSRGSCGSGTSHDSKPRRFGRIRLYRSPAVLEASLQFSGLYSFTFLELM